MADTPPPTLWSSVPICNEALAGFAFCPMMRHGANQMQTIIEHGNDKLTGLIDTDAALAKLARWQAAARPGEAAPIHAMLLSLKRFSAVNLAYGEAAGDAALVEVGARIAQFARAQLTCEWVVTRLRGGTFLLAANEACSRERWQWLAEELALGIAHPILTAPLSDPGGRNALRLWPRMALLRAVEGETPARMLSRMGEALESGRQSPGRRFCWVDGTISLPGRPAQQLEADLITALETGEIEMLFQPQYACADNRIVGAEALARWQHPELGQIGAAALFAIAERADHVGQLSRRIARLALASARDWPEHQRLSLNITAADLATRDFADTIAGALADAGFAAEQLTLEITEQALVSDLDRSAARLRHLADLGICIALDDFGAGFCNFHYLKVLPLHSLKLDRAMIEGITDDARDLAVFRGIVAMARALDLKVVAEGIETEAQRDAVAREGCDAWQGFLGARPLEAAEFAELAGR